MVWLSVDATIRLRAFTSVHLLRFMTSRRLLLINLIDNDFRCCQRYGGRHLGKQGFHFGYGCRGRLPETAERCWYPCVVASVPRSCRQVVLVGEGQLPTFNTLHGANKQIILSSDRPPKDMDILEDRIRSRFEWGLLADIQSPDYETRIAILRKKQELDGYSVSDDVIEYIASNIKSNIRELEGALNKIIAYANLEKREINIDLAEQVLRDIISPNEI